MDVFSAIADPLRRQLLVQLRATQARVVDLAAAHAVSRPAISRHLAILLGSGLVEVNTVGRERIYRLSPAPLALVVDYLDALREPEPPVGAGQWASLELEVRRTTRDRRHSTTTIREDTA